MTRITDDELARLSSGFATQVTAIVPGWTEPPSHDPGVTLVQLFAFLSEQLLYRTNVWPHEVARPLATAIDALKALQSQSGASFDGLTRVHYFAGQLLTADDLQTEQDYVRAKQRRHNRLLVGAGVVSGLRVVIEDSSTHDEPAVSVDPGCAIAPNGEELAIATRVTCRLCATAATGFVTLDYAERFASPVPAVAESDMNEPTRIQEGIRVAFAEHAADEVIALAKLERHHGDWRIATDFHPPRAGRHEGSQGGS